MVRQLHRVWWHKTSLFHRAAVPANPVLLQPEISGRFILTAHTIHQHAVQLAHKAKPNRVILQVFTRRLQRLAMVGKFLNILKFFALFQQPCFLLKHFINGGLGTFDF